MLSKSLKWARELTVGVLMLVCGIIIGYQYKDREAGRTLTSLSASLQVDEARKSAMVLTAIQRNELRCARWLLRSDLRSVTANINQYELQSLEGELSRKAFDDIKQAATHGNKVLSSIDEADFDISAGCNLQ